MSFKYTQPHPAENARRAQRVRYKLYKNFFSDSLPPDSYLQSFCVSRNVFMQLSE